MNEILYNYSGLQKRDTKIYSVGGSTIAGGVSVNFLKIVAPVAIVVILIGFLLSLIFNINMFNPFGGNWNWAWLVIWVGAGIGLGLVMWNVQFSGYRLYQYLLAYMKPKHVYSNVNSRDRIFKFTNIKIKCLIKQII